MDAEDSDVVLTGYNTTDASPQRLVLNQAHEQPAPFSNFIAPTDPPHQQDDGSRSQQSPDRRLASVSETGSVACAQDQTRSPARKSDPRSSPTCSPGLKWPHGRHCKHEAERDFQWLGAPEATMSPAQASRPEQSRLEWAAAQSSAAALHALKASINRFDVDENQGSDANTVTSEPRGSLHLPAFEKLMQVMNRLEQTTEDDNGDTTSVMSGQVSYAHHSPSKDGSPPQLSRPTPFDAQRTPTSATSQDVASHPITIGKASSPPPAATRPMLLNRHIDQAPMFQEPEQGTDIFQGPEEGTDMFQGSDQDTDMQQPWHLKTPSVMHTGEGCIDSQSGLGYLQERGELSPVPCRQVDEASSATETVAAPEQHSISSDQGLLFSGTREKESNSTAAPDAERDEFAELAALRESISSRGRHMHAQTVCDKHRYDASPSQHCDSSEATDGHSAHQPTGGVDTKKYEPVEKSRALHDVNGGELLHARDPSLLSPFPGIGEVPWPAPGNMHRSSDKASEPPLEIKVQSYVQQHISREWELINQGLSAANVTGVQHEDTCDWHAFENSVHKAVSCLLSEYEKQGQLVQQLLSVADGASTEKTRHASALKTLQRERDSLAHDLKREKEGSSQRDALHKKEMAETKSQLKALESTVKKLHRDAEAAAKASSRQGMERHALESSTTSTQSELAELKKRVSSLSDTLAKTQADSKRLQGYSKQLEATQRLKDAQLTELDEHKSDSVRRIDELERACTAATKDAQQHEAQIASLHRQLREAQVAVRNAEKEADQQQGESSRLTTQSEMAAQRAYESEAALKEATAQMRSLTSRTTALEAQLRAKELEAEELQATMTASRKGSSEVESRGVQLHADLRGACADIANLTAQLGVQTAVAHSREVEIEELKTAVREAGFRQEAAGDALDDTVGENKRLAMQCAQIQCSLKTQVATLRAREAELDDVRASYTSAEVRVDNLSQRLKVSGVELSKTEEALKLSQRQARSLGNRLHESESQCQALQASLQSVESKKGDAQVLNKSTAQQLAAARAEADRVRAALQATENQLSAKDERISALHADLHLLDAQKDELKHAFADASGAVASAADNSSALESRTRALQAQLRDHDEAEAVMKEQVSSLRAQRDKLEDTLKEHIKQAKASENAKAAEASRADSLRSQLAARGEEADALRSQLSLVEDEMHDCKTKNTKSAAQLETAERSKQGQENKISVLSNQLRSRDDEAAALKAQLKAMDGIQSSAQNAAETSHREMWRTDAMLSAERDRARLLENQLADAQQAQSDALNKQEEADAASRATQVKATESARKCAHLEAQVKTLQGRVKVLDVQLKGAQQEESTLKEALLEAQSERGTSVHTAAKESSALSSSLRASHARMVVLEKQLSERDQQITSLRVQVSQVHAESGGAAQHSRDAAAQILAAEQRAKNLTARNQLMQTQMASLQQEIEGLKEALTDEKEHYRTDVAGAAEATMSMRALHAQISNLRSSVKIVEHQLSEKTDEAEQMRTMLAMHDDSAQTAASAILSAQLAEASRDQALEDSRKRASCLQRRLDMQQCTLQDAQADSAAANDTADAARRQVAHLAAEVHRATLRADAAVAHASGIDAALASADADLAEVRAMLLQQHTVSGAATVEASTHTKGLEAQVRGMTVRLQVLEKQLQDREKMLETAEKSTGDMKDKVEAASVKAAQQDSELSHMHTQLRAARKAHEQALAVAAERNAELEMLRNELSELLVNQDAMAQAGAETVRSEKVLRAGLRGLDSELRSVHAALARKDADAVATDEALANCRDEYRAARSEAASAHERCEVLRKQVRSLQSNVQRHAAVAQAAQDGVQEAHQVALDEAKRADDVEGHVANLEKVVQRFNVQQAALKAAQDRHNTAATKAAEAVADTRKIAIAERENSVKARQSAVDAGALVEAMQQEVQQLRSAHDAQLHASDAATAATQDLQQALLDQQAEVRVLAAEASAAASHAASSSREVSMLQSQLIAIKVQMHEQTEALILAEQQLQQTATDRVAEHVGAVRAAQSLERAGANVESLHRELGEKEEGVEALRQRLSDIEGQLQKESQEHGATRAEQVTVTTALDRKAAALQNLEAEKGRLAVSLKHAEEVVKELTHAQLEGTAQDAAARKAQHVNEISLRHAQEQIAQLNHQLQAVTEVKNEQSQAIKALEGSLAAVRVDAAQQNVADSASAAAVARGEADIRHLKQRIVSLQQELSGLAKEKQALEGQVAYAADERMKSSEELGRAAKAMLLAQTEVQKQIESMKKKGASNTAALREARAEIASLRGMTMDAQMELKQSNTDGPHVRKLEADVSSLRDKLHEAQLQTHAEAEARQQVIREAGQFEETAETAAVQLQQAKDEVASLQKECGNLKLQVTQLTHSLREGEKRLEKTREQLGTSISKEERFHTRGKQAYARIRAAWACSKGTSKAAGAIASASREMRPVEIVSIYEEQKAQVEADVKRLSAENAVLLSQVRDLENKVTLASRELSNSGAPVAAELQAQLVDASRTVGQLRAEVQRQDVEAGDAARMHARQLAEAQGRADMLQEENATLLVELNTRPSHKDYSGARREADIMRQRLTRLEASRDSDGADGASEQAERQPDRRLMTTKDRIARDKRLAALNLSHVDHLPHVVLAEIVQDACLALEVTEPTHLHASMLRVLRSANQVPQLEQFLDAVNDCIFKRGAKLVPMHLHSEDTANASANVVPVLELWQEQLHDATHVDTAMHHIHSLLHGRDEAPAPPSLNGLVSAVQKLVQNRNNAQSTLDTFKSLDADFKDNPSGGIVRHFQDLFAVQSTAGCIPMMSKVYAEHRAGVTFLQALSDMLRTPRSSAACLDRVEALLNTSVGRELQLKKGIVEQLQPSRNTHTGGTQPASNSAAAEEMNMVLQQASHLLGCDAAGIVPAVQHMQTRLQRFNGLLPKYQQVLSQVYEALRISSLDEVVPAMERLMNESC